MQTWIDVMLLVRTMLYILCAYGFFTLATYSPGHELRGHRLMRQSCYALTVFFLLAGYKTATSFAHVNTVLADTLLTPAVFVVVVLVYTGVLYLSRDRSHNGNGIKVH